MTPTDTYLGLRAFVDELARCGMRDACTSPGSRSTPLVLSLVRDGRLRCWSHIDERAGGFFAIGAAKAGGRPVALACTSGTAAANYLPAVVEAYEARVPLLVLTTDRPPELRDVGAGQTIDQVKLYGRNAKWYLEVDEAPATPERLRWMRWLACRAWWTAQDGRPGPVHLNFFLREPLILDAPLPDDDTGRPDGAPWVIRTPVAPAASGVLAAELAERPRAIVVAGRQEREDGARLEELARRLGLPLLADPLSGARRGEAIAHYDAFLRDPDPDLSPDLVIRTGDLPTSKPLRQWLGRIDARQIALDPENAWQDPASAVARVIPAGPEALDVPGFTGGRDWLEAWRAADGRAREAIGAVLSTGEVTEPGVAARLWAQLPGDATLVVASSMPIRDLETFAVARADPPRVLSNRGANGIDGTISTAYGVAAASDGPVVLLIGDVAVAHDIGGLLAAGRLGLDVTIVVVNNDGGGIFHFLPVAGERDAFEEHVATPHGLDFEKLAALFGLSYTRAHTLADLDADLRAPGIVELRTERDANVALHRRIWESVRASA
jgi:2-succinyl-5-enolpyruvyl-6-hydroxy-3-cyclohexene-1-carboxylate synthase